MIAWVHILIRRIILMAIDLDTNQKLQQTQFYRNLRKQFIYWRKKKFHLYKHSKSYNLSFIIWGVEYM